MTDEELKAIEKRVNAGTQWTPDKCNIRPPDPNDPDDYLYAPQGATIGGTLITLDDTYEDSGPDWNFVAHARQDVKALLKVLKETQRTLAFVIKARENDLNSAVANEERLAAVPHGTSCEEDDGLCGICI
jgi:hypothetical protein